MHSFHVLWLSVLVLSLAYAAPEKSTDFVISTPRGRLRGRHVDFGNNTEDFLWGSADVFLGIPFVLPPVDELRFQKPIPLCQYTKDDSVYDARKYKAACLQYDDCANAPGQSEDCLHLNVFTPNASSQYKYPVMVWIHGGSLMTGCAAEFPYAGAVANLVSRGVVIVTIQYRLSLLGFFTDGTDAFPPNLGMLDQVEAIRWVRDQIEYFGGDPDRITLFGQSAGGASVSAHTYSPLSQDLFEQAIMQSGVVLTSYEGSLGYSNLSEKRAYEVCKVTPIQFHSGRYTDVLKRCFAEKNPVEWLKYDALNIVGWKMQTDDYFLPDIPHRLARFRRSIPVMLGSMLDEWTLFDMYLLADGVLTFENYTRQFFAEEFNIGNHFLEPRLNDTRAILENVYAGVNASDDDHEVWLRANSGVYTSLGFTSFIQRDYADYLANGNNAQHTWLYLMTYPEAINRPYDLPGWPDAVFHTAELPYLWHIEDAFNASMAKSEVSREDYELSEWFGKTWTNFAKLGNPDPMNGWPNLPATGKEVYMDINSASPVVNNKTGYMVTDNVVWNQVVVALEGDFYPPQFDGNPGISQEDFNRIKSSYLSNSLCGSVYTSNYTSPVTQTPSSFNVSNTTSTFPSVHATTKASLEQLSGWPLIAAAISFTLFW